MIVEKHKKETETIEEVVSEIKQSKQLILEESYNVNALAEAYLAVKEILSGIKLNDTPDSPPLFRTIKLDTGQLTRIKNNKHNQQYALAFPAVFIHFINVLQRTEVGYFVKIQFTSIFLYSLCFLCHI